MAIALENHPNDSRVKYATNNVVQTLSGRMGTGGGNVPLVMEQKFIECHQQDSRMRIVDGGLVNQTLGSNMSHDALNGGAVLETTTYSMGHDERSAGFTPECCDPLTASDYKQPTIVNQKYIVRRLTPKECERLQGLPDDWTLVDGATDSKRYKAIGNGMAQPCADYVMQCVVEMAGGKGINE